MITQEVGKMDKLKEEDLLDSDERCDLMDAVMELHPNLPIKLQNTILNLIDLTIKTQAAKSALIREAKDLS